MRGEIPEFKRCCFCVPLRKGLISWGYVKLVLSLLIIVYMIRMTALFLFMSVTFRAKEISIMTFIWISLLADVALNILFIIAGHKKSMRLLRISFIHNLVWLSLLIAGNCFQLYANIRFYYRSWETSNYRRYLLLDSLFCLLLAFSTIFVQVYLVLLIRSERIKLQNETLEMQFSNHLATGEPQCTLHDASVVDQGTGKDARAVQSTDGQPKEAFITV